MWTDIICPWCGLATHRLNHRYQAHVEAEQTRAHQLGARGVPFLVIDEKLGMTDAQKPEHIIEALERAWNEHTDPATKKPS